MNKASDKKTYSHSFEHTSKLTQNIDLKFISSSFLKITLNQNIVKSLNLELIHDNDDGTKITLLKKTITTSQTLKIGDITSDFDKGTIVALLNGKDKNNQPISKVATYNVQHQSEIDDAKKRSR